MRSLGEAAATAGLAARRAHFLPGAVIWEAGETPGHVLFVEKGLVALRWSDSEGALAEAAAIGSDGAVGLMEALAHGPFAFEARAELDTVGLLVPAERLRRLAENDPAAAGVFWAYALELQARAHRGVGCAVRHATQARLADYILARSLASDEAWLTLTQEDVATALGLYRTTVTALLARLVGDGIISTGRGRLRVLETGRLAQAACGCRQGPAPKLDRRQTASPP